MIDLPAAPLGPHYRRIVEFKIAVLLYKFLHGQTPHYV